MHCLSVVNYSVLLLFFFAILKAKIVLLFSLLFMFYAVLFCPSCVFVSVLSLPHACSVLVSMFA